MLCWVAVDGLGELLAFRIGKRCLVNSDQLCNAVNDPTNFVVSLGLWM